MIRKISANGRALGAEEAGVRESQRQERGLQYFVRAMEKHYGSDRTFGPDSACSDLQTAKAEAKRMVLASDPAIRLQADACTRNGLQVRTKYRCWLNERGDFQDSVLV